MAGEGPPLLVPLPAVGGEQGTANNTHLAESGQYTYPPTGVVGRGTTPKLVYHFH